MAQSIASSQENVGPGRLRRGNWKSIFAGPWSTITAKNSRSASNIRQSGFSSGSDIADTLNIDRISARLNIEKRAESDGRNDQPPSTDESVSGTQREIVVYFKELQRKAQHQITDLAYKLRELGDEIDLLGVGGSVRDIPSRCENEVLRLIAESQSQLNFLGERETRQQQHHTALLEKGQQNQDTERPISPVFHWVFMAFLIGIAAFAIAKNSALGFGSQGLVPPSWAIAISLIVVLASFVISHAVSRSVSLAGRMAGWLCGAIGIGVIGIMASLAANYITAVTINPGIALRSVIDSILADPIANVTNVADWNAFGIVLSAGLMAFLVSYRPDSSTPDHAATQSAIHRTRRKRDRLTKRLRTQINAIIDDADADATELPKRLKAQISHYSKLVDESKRIPASLSDYDVALEDGCSILLDRYRTANTNARKTEVPMSFSEHICFRPEQEPNVSMFDNEEGRLQELHQGIVELESEAAEVRQKLRDLNSRAISALEDAPAAV